MGTLSDYSSAESVAQSKRGQTSYSGGSKPITPTKTVDTRSVVGRIGDIAGESERIAESGLKKAASFVANTPKYVYEGVKPFLNSTARVITGQINADTNQIAQQTKQLDDQLNRYSQQYKSGKMSKARWTEALKQHNEQSGILSKAAKENVDNLAREQSDVAVSAANTAATILLGGRLKLASTPKGAIRRTAGAISEQSSKNKVLQSIVDQNATKLEKAVATVPAVRDLVQRNLQYLGKREGQQLAGENLAQYVGREGKALAVNMVLKRPLLYETNINGAQDIYNKMLEGNPDDAAKQAAWLSTQMLSGGPIGAVAKGFNWLKKGTRDLAYGSGSFIDELSKQIGTKQSNQVANYLGDLKNTDPKAFKDAEKVLRVVQEANLQMAGDDATQAANRVLQHWDEYGIQLDGVTPEKVVGLLKNWADAHQLLTQGIKNNKVLANSVVARWDVAARQALATKIEDAGDDFNKIVETYQTWALAPGNAAAQNSILTKRIEKLINEEIDWESPGAAKQLAETIRSMNAASLIPKDIPEELAKKLSKLGFIVAEPSRIAGKVTPAVDYNDTRKLVTAAQNADKEVFDAAIAPQPQLGFFARAAERLGVSPNESNQVAQRTLSQQVVADLGALNQAKSLGFRNSAEADVTEGGRAILSKLQDYIERKEPSRIGNALVAGRAVGPAISDIRQLTNKEIMEALGNVDSAQARAISESIIDAYAKVPMEFRGLGDKIVDNLYKIPGYKSAFNLPGYSRIQSALRYTYNPFFRTQESVETSALSRAQARTILWNKSTNELDAAAKTLDEAGIFKTGLSGEAAQDLTLGRITANLTQGQKRNMAGLAESMAKQYNMSLEQMIQKHPDEIGDALRVVVQYPNKGVLNSSLARTLNIAFFPMRYNAKVTALAAKILSKEAPSVQLATINSLFNLRDWLKSDEGIQWQSQNADAIQVFNWITPINSIEYGLQRLTHKPNSIGEMGSLGGLPLGFITQMLDSQGLINLNTPYVSPKTGDVIPKYVPETTKARAATAMGDLLNSMFTYPGRTLGLPGKNQAINTIVRQFIDTHGTDFEKQIQTERLTPLQQNWIRVLKGDTSDEAIDALYNSPAPGEFNWYTLPPLDLPIRTPIEGQQTVERRTDLPTKAAKGKKQKNYALPIAR